MNGTPNTPDTLRQEISVLLSAERSPHERGDLLRQMDRLSRRPGFEACAGLWAPALYTHDPNVFGTFLLRHLDDEQPEVVKDLLARAEADGHDTLFSGLYRKIIDEDEWNADLSALAAAALPDDEIARAVARRDMHRDGYTLADETALALYRRNPALFRPFLEAHVRRTWDMEGEAFPELRAEAKRRGDEEFYWLLFRRLAEPEEWSDELAQLLSQHVPAGSITAELRRRHPDSVDEVNAHILADFFEQYGMAMLPYLDQNLQSISRGLGRRLAETARKLGDEDLYWRLFFKAPDLGAWNDALRNLLKQPLDEETLAREVGRRTPPPERRMLRLANDVAERLYTRNPSLFRPFVEAWLGHATIPLFHIAEDQQDEVFLDTLTVHFLRELVTLVFQAYPYGARARRQRPDHHAQHQVTQIGQVVNARFDRLYATSPREYVRHAASIMSRCDDEAIGSIKRTASDNPVFAYLYTRHRSDWVRSPAAIRELLESPAASVRLIGLVFLESGGTEAARCVAEQLPLLRAMLLDRSPRGAKKRALAALRLAAEHDPLVAQQVMPLLEDALHYQGESAIDERIMVSYVRLRVGRAAEAAPQAT